MNIGTGPKAEGTTSAHLLVPVIWIYIPIVFHILPFSWSTGCTLFCYLFCCFIDNFFVTMQMLRQMHPQMQQMINPQSATLQQQQQQQWERMRRRQQSTPRPAVMGANMNVNIEKDRPLVEVKLENPSDFAMDSNTSNAINAMNARNSQLIQMQQLRQQQQLAAMQASHSQSGNQFRPMANPQIPQVHSP